MKKIFIIGIGPGAYEKMTLEAIRALEMSDVIVGYDTYTKLIRKYFKDKEFFSSPMKQEIERCIRAFEIANSGKTVGFICSGDAGVYGLAGLLYSIGKDYDVELEVIAGVSAAMSGAALLGAPLVHDFAIISLSDLLTPWEKIEKRILLASLADFSIVLYNPSSRKRADYLKRACDIILKNASENTNCGYVRNISRENQEIRILKLCELRDVRVDMFTTVFIGNSQTEVIGNKLVTPRGYENKEYFVNGRGI